jgi:hypothetical protein
MNECPFETDVLDALASRRWPARAGEELQAHVASCESCRDLAAVAGALLHEEEAAFSAARVPAAASVWHRAQIRAREDAVRAAARPLGFAQGLAFACALAALLAAGVWGLPILTAAMPDLATIRGAVRMPTLPGFDPDSSGLLSNTTLMAVVGFWAVLAPIALYFTLRKIED